MSMKYLKLKERAKKKKGPKMENTKNKWNIGNYRLWHWSC
jgi:hypothetical protein